MALKHFLFVDFETYYDTEYSLRRMSAPEYILHGLFEHDRRDRAILAWRYGWVAGRLADTLGMARALKSYKRYSLGAVAKELFGHDSKGDVIGKVKGMRVQDIKNAGLWPAYRTYAMNDVSLCAMIYF